MIRPISQLKDDASSTYGGKAASLGALSRRGLPVPPAVALAVSDFRSFLKHNGLWDRAKGLHRRPDPDALRQLRMMIENGRLPPKLAGTLRQAGAELGDRLVVRSSAIEEDGGENSFAGQFLSVMNVRPGDAVETAVKQCWASAFSHQAVTYRKARGVRGQPGMGVVVQRLVDAKTSGVVFTMNPVTGSFSELVVEAVWGQGEALVSGQVAPDRYLVKRPRKLPRGLGRIWNRLHVQELEADVLPQARRLAPLVKNTLEWAKVERPLARKLSKQEVERLSRMALRAEQHTGQPQDLEWAIDADGQIFVLQARPITAAGDPERGDGVLWTRRFIGERWAGLATPMGWSITGPMLTWLIDYPETSLHYLGGAPPLRLLRGRPYANVTVFRHLAFKLPGRSPPSFMMDFLPPREVERWTRRFAYPPDLQVYRSIFQTTFAEQRWQRFRWNPWSNHKAWDAFAQRLSNELPALAVVASGVEEGLTQLDQLIELKRDYLKIHVVSLLFANLSYQIMRGELPHDLADDVLTAPADNPTVQTNQALYALATGAMTQASFLSQYGHRSSQSSWELFATRWAEDPAALDPLLEPYRSGKLGDPQARVQEQIRASKQALAALRQRLPAQDRQFTLRKVDLARRYLQLREEQRFEFDRLMWALKRCVTDLGQRLLEAPEQVRFLELDELRARAVGTLSPKDTQVLMARRAKQWAEYAAQPAPPTFLLGDEGVEVQESGASLVGLGISAGRHTGSARILHSIEDAERLQPGDILVTTATDPGWTPLFLVAGAVVLELGSMLSHGAVVAREYRLPAVVNVEGATTRLQDGMRITVDGGRGRVWIEEE
ncbi:MAG: phosphohistidine swiveling domain-containing protein [Cognaticolwellia sp.]